jgi:hypothetical protein
LDFVVVGLTLGALAVLAGVVLLGWSTSRWQHAAARADSAAAANRYAAIAADRRGTGESLLYAGAATILATVGALAGSLDDRTGAFFVVTTVTVAAVGMLLRSYLHRARHPIPAAPRLAARAVPPTRPGQAINVLFAEPSDHAEEAVELDAAEDLVTAPDDPVGTPPEVPEDVIKAAPVAVAAADTEHAVDEDSGANDQEVVG